TRAVAREIGRAIGPEEARSLQDRHDAFYHDLLPRPRPLPGARELLARLRDSKVPHGIATSGRRPAIDPSLEALGVPPSLLVVDQIGRASCRERGQVVVVGGALDERTRNR